MACRLVGVVLLLGLIGVPLGIATSRAQETQAVEKSAGVRATLGREVTAVHPGVISGNIYTNQFFGFSLEIPVGWKAAENAALQALAEKNKRALAHEDPAFTQYARGEEVDSPLLILGERAVWKEGHHRLIQIVSTDLSARPGEPSAEDFLNFWARISAEKGDGREYDGRLETVVVDGRELWKAHFTQATSIVWHETQLALIVKKHAVQFILISPDEEGLQGLEPLLKTLHFHEESKSRQ